MLNERIGSRSDIREISVSEWGVDRATVKQVMFGKKVSDEFALAQSDVVFAFVNIDAQITIVGHGAEFEGVRETLSKEVDFGSVIRGDFEVIDMKRDKCEETVRLNLVKETRIR